MWRSAWYQDTLLRFGAGDLSALYAARPSYHVILSVHSFRRADTPGAASERLGLLHPALAAGLDALERLGAYRAALDALGTPAAFFDADGREVHRTPALSRLLAADPSAAPLTEAIAALARRARAHAFPRRGEAASLQQRRVQTPSAAYLLRATRLAPGALRGTEAFLVTAERTSAALPDTEALREAYGLTQREGEVARLVACGLPNAAIAEALAVSPHTVRHHVEAAMAKLGLAGHGREAVAASLLGLSAAA